VLEISCRHGSWNSSSPYLFSEEKEKEKLMYVHGNQNSSSILCYQEEERLTYVHGTRILQAHLCRFMLWGKREIGVCAWDQNSSNPFCAVRKKRDWCRCIGTWILPTDFVLWGIREIDACAWEPEFFQHICVLSTKGRLMLCVCFGRCKLVTILSHLIMCLVAQLSHWTLSLTNVWSLLWKDYSMATMQQCWLMDRCNFFLSWNLDMFLVT
jgi:hypothetical protein